MQAPDCLHVIIYSDSGLRGPISTPEVWQRYRALYGSGYQWSEATPEETDAYHAENQRLKTF